MKPVEIRIELLRKGFTNSKVASELRLSRSTVGEVIHGRQRSRRVAEKIAKITGLTVGQMWPGQYVAKVQRKVSTRHAIKRVSRSAGR